MEFPVIKAAAYVMVHAPDILLGYGTTPTMERKTNPDSPYLKELPGHLRSFAEAVKYPPNQVYIGNYSPELLEELPRPWYHQEIEATAQGNFGEIIGQSEFYALLKLVDRFNLVELEAGFALELKKSLESKAIFSETELALLDKGWEAEDIKNLVNLGKAEGLYSKGSLVGCVREAHEHDPNLKAHVVMENLVSKASAVLALKNLLTVHKIDPAQIDYIIETSEEAIGDMNQRGGGNLAKAIGEAAGLINASGVDLRAFCAGPAHGMVNAASLVQSGIFKNVVIVAGGSSAKLGMNSKDHIAKGSPVLEDMLAGFALLVSENDGVSPVLRTDIIGKHKIGSGSAPQAVMQAIVVDPLINNGLKLTDVELYAPELQNPEITVPAGAGDVPLANFKMIGAMAVKRGEMEKSQLLDFVREHGVKGFAPTQGHIPSGVPAVGHVIESMKAGKIKRAMIIGKGSLFLGRMTDLFDGISIIIEKNQGLKPAERKGTVKDGTVKETAPEAGAVEAEVPREAALETGTVKREINQAAAPENETITIGLTVGGSEVGLEDMLAGARQAMKGDQDLQVVIIGECDSREFTVYEAKSEEEIRQTSEHLLQSGEIQGLVTMHYPFPIGVTTIGKVITPAKGKEMYIASTTGTADTNRVQAMIKNAVYGIAVARAEGISDPTVGILNVEGARQAERNLRQMQEKGYRFTWGSSARQDGGAVLRGNDIIAGTVDVCVTDSLTGNILMKLFSAFNSGGQYETTGFGYGPGIGEDFDRLICIISRASGTPVISSAIAYCASMVKNNWQHYVNQEISLAKKIGWEVSTFTPAGAAGSNIISARELDPDTLFVKIYPMKLTNNPVGATRASEVSPPGPADTRMAPADTPDAANEEPGQQTAAEIVCPAPKTTDCEIHGIDILELDEAVQKLWKEGIYATSGMGCTGPVIMVNKEDYDKAKQLLS
jgi:betaine reductase